MNEGADRGTEFGASTCDASEEDHEERRGEGGADGAVFSRLLLFLHLPALSPWVRGENESSWASACS